MLHNQHTHTYWSKDFRKNKSINCVIIHVQVPIHVNELPLIIVMNKLFSDISQ